MVQDGRHFEVMRWHKTQGAKWFQVLFIDLPGFCVNWFVEVEGTPFFYLTIRDHWWRFSPAGYMTGVKPA